MEKKSLGPISVCVFTIICALFVPSVLIENLSGESIVVEATVAGVERHMNIAKEKYSNTDILVFDTTFGFSNLQTKLVKISEFDFTVKIDDGTPDKTTIDVGTMPDTYIPGGMQIVWSHSAIFNYGKLNSSYIFRGVGGGTKEDAIAAAKEVWKALGEDKKTFYIEGRFVTSFPEHSDLGIKIQNFSATFKIPGL